MAMRIQAENIYNTEWAKVQISKVKNTIHRPLYKWERGTLVYVLRKDLVEPQGGKSSNKSEKKRKTMKPQWFDPLILGCPSQTFQEEAGILSGSSPSRLVNQ